MQVVDLERKQDHLNNYPAMIFGSSKSNDTLHLPRRTWLVIGLQIWQEFTGIGVVTVCESDPGVRWDLGPDRTDEVDAPTVFQSAGYSAYKADWLAGLNDITYSEVASHMELIPVFSVLVAVFTLDRVGRRVTLFCESLFSGPSNLDLDGMAPR
jgi:hypothetical protein